VEVVIHHNPECGTSRNVLAIIEAADYKPYIVDYMKTGWSEPQLRALFAVAGITARDALRLTKSPARELGLDDLSVENDQLIAMMIRYPVLVNRPIVCTSKGVRLCRPSERVIDLLDRFPKGPFYKEDGSLLIVDKGKLIE
jgi:arsenate reductase (glutaredoxin)